MSEKAQDQRVARDHPLDEKEMRFVYCDTIISMFEEGLPVLHLDADCMTGIGLYPHRKKYPEQIIECGVSEANMIGVAAGFSMEGYIPFAHSLASFASRRPYDQIYISGAYAKANIRIISTDSGVATGYNGGTHGAIEDIAIMRAIPGMTILEPTDSVMLKDLLRTVVHQYGVFYIRLTRRKLPLIYKPGSKFPLGGSVTVRDGRDITLVSCGFLVSEMLRIANKLESEGISARVIDLYSIKPIDSVSILKAAWETGAIVTVENHNILGGIGSAVAELLVENTPVPMSRVGINDQFLFSASPEWLMEHYGLSDQDILTAVRKTILRKKGQCK